MLHTHIDRKHKIPKNSEIMLAMMRTIRPHPHAIGADVPDGLRCPDPEPTGVGLHRPDQSPRLILLPAREQNNEERNVMLRE